MRMDIASQTKPLIGLISQFDEANDYYYLAADYSRAVAAAGGIPVQIPLIAETATALAAHLDGIVLCGSASDVDPARYGRPRHEKVGMIHRERDDTDLAVLEEAFHEKIPILGICYGVQSLNVYLHGTLVQDIPAEIPAAMNHQGTEILHSIAIQPDSRMDAWAGGTRQIMVNSTHHQAIQTLGQGLRVAALAPDGVIEAVEGNFADHFVVGVQWHPERIRRDERVSARTLMELVRAAAERRRKRSELQPAIVT